MLNGATAVPSTTWVVVPVKKTALWITVNTALLLKLPANYRYTPTLPYKVVVAVALE